MEIRSELQHLSILLFHKYFGAVLGAPKNTAVNKVLFLPLGVCYVMKTA